MTYIEALQRLEEWYDGKDVDISPEVLGSCYDALKIVAFKAKKPLLICGQMKCPNCRRNERALHFFCDCCGQPIDWSDEINNIIDELNSSV